MQPARTESLVDDLAAAARDNEPIPLLGRVTASHETAYAVQREVFSRRCARLDTRLAGYKVSMTSDEALALVGATEPAYGPFAVADIMANEGIVARTAMNAPMLEPELVFCVRNDLSGAADTEEVAASCDVAAGIEIPDSRFRGWFSNVGPFELIADCAAAGRLAIGDERVPADTVDLTSVRGEIVSRGEVVVAGEAVTVMGNPLRAVAWLARKLADHGSALRAGMVVSSGTFAMPAPAEPGTYTARYTGVGSVTVTVTG